MSAALPEALRTRPIPDSEPTPDRTPYLSRADPAAAPGAAPVQPTLALALVTSPVDAAAYAFERFDPFDRLERRPTATSELPDPTAWSRRLVQAVIEALSGIRPVAQLVRWTSPDVYAGLQRRCHQPAGRPAALASGRAVVRSVRVCEPADGVVEACAVVVARGRVQAVALRLEGLDGRWRMTALELG